MLGEYGGVMGQVMNATSDDLPAVSRTLAKAFVDDPLIRHLLGGTYDHRRAELSFRMLATSMLRHGTVLCTEDRSAAALWAHVDAWKVPITEVVRQVPVVVRAYRRHVFRALGVLNRMERCHPHEPHYYLEVIGTDPVAQGRGYGASLIQPMLDKADAEGVGAYLESSRDINVPYYRKFGFEVVGEIHHRNGPMMWPMWRDPR
ncbi:MAG: GNAT family N-acetyltransferase [Actinobacteria bacterium]|nr:GNAT family N-acetyltransferase [Actinomycetota bacterium]